MHYGRNQRAGMLCAESRAKAAKWQMHGFSIVALLLFIVFCIQSQGPAQVASSSGEDAVMESYPGSTSFTFLGRNYKQRMVENQMLEKDREIRDLQYQISRAMLSTKLADTNLQAAQNMISMLSEREQTERQARTKAQYALAEKIAEYSECTVKRDQLEARLAQCGDELMQLSRQAREDPTNIDDQVPRSDGMGIPLPETVQSADSVLQVPRIPHQSSVGRRRSI